MFIIDKSKEVLFVTLNMLRLTLTIIKGIWYMPLDHKINIKW